MRCYCCNRNLNDAESTARHPDTNEFTDTCFTCLSDSGITPIIREDFTFTEESDDWDELDMEEEE